MLQCGNLIVMCSCVQVQAGIEHSILSLACRFILSKHCTELHRTLCVNICVGLYCLSTRTRTTDTNLSGWNFWNSVHSSQNTLHMLSFYHKSLQRFSVSVECALFRPTWNNRNNFPCQQFYRGFKLELIPFLGKKMFPKFLMYVKEQRSFVLIKITM